MGTRGSNESKARGGLARSQALTPERRQEIARKAAQSRWGPSRSTASTDTPAQAPRRRAVVKKLKGISSVKHLVVSSTISSARAGCKSASISESGQVLRTFVGLAEFVDERIQGYLAALQDLGIELVVRFHESPPEAGQPSGLTPAIQTSGTPGT